MLTQRVDLAVAQLLGQVGGRERPDPGLADDHVARLRRHALVDRCRRRVVVQHLSGSRQGRRERALLGDGVVVGVVECDPDVAHLPAMAPNDRDRLSDP